MLRWNRHKKGLCSSQIGGGCCGWRGSAGVDRTLPLPRGAWGTCSEHQCAIDTVWKETARRSLQYYSCSILCLLSSWTIQPTVRTSQWSKVSQFKALGVWTERVLWSWPLISIWLWNMGLQFPPSHKPACASSLVGQQSGPCVPVRMPSCLFAEWRSVTINKRWEHCCES